MMIATGKLKYTERDQLECYIGHHKISLDCVYLNTFPAVKAVICSSQLRYDTVEEFTVVPANCLWSQRASSSSRLFVYP
jgi:hypothetical protein